MHNCYITRLIPPGYCNGILAGLPASTLMPLQRAQNAAARLVLGLDRRSSITTALRDLHCMAADQVPHHLQSRNSDASSSSSSLSSVLGWPRRVQLNRLSSAAPLLLNDQSSRDTENSDPVRKMGFICLRSRRVEQSSSMHLSALSTPTRPSAVLSKLICSSLRLTTNCLYFLFYHFLTICNARSAGFYLVWLGTITFYHIISYHIISYHIS